MRIFFLLVAVVESCGWSFTARQRILSSFATGTFDPMRTPKKCDTNATAPWVEPQPSGNNLTIGATAIGSHQVGII